MMNLALAGLVVLIIGDSHMAFRDYLIGSLPDALISLGATVDSYGVCGANAADWVYRATEHCGWAERHNKDAPRIGGDEAVRVWSIDDLIARDRPNLVIVELGDTMAGYGQASLPRTWIWAQVRPLTERISAHDVPCAWVGPPWGSEGTRYHKTFSRVREMSDFLAEIVSPCHFIDSTRFAKPGEWPTTDGQHLTASGYRSWGDDIAAAIVGLSLQQHVKR
jgi:hypothetical protein